MKIFTRTNIDPWPYAASSAGPYRGILARKYPCWDAHGPAREMFMTQITGKIKHCLEQCLPESDSFVGYSLFMVGKSSHKTKPCVMIVSDDRKRRKAAFQLIKSKQLMAEFPGFELGHRSLGAEFEDLRQLGRTGYNPEPIPTYDSTAGSEKSLECIGDDLNQYAPPTEVCGPQVPSWAQPFSVGLHTPSRYHTWSATCGALFRDQGQLYSITVLHGLQGSTRSEIEGSPSTPSDTSIGSHECEITGMEDWDDEEEKNSESLTIDTSASSRSPFEHLDSDDDLVHSPCSSEIETPVVAPVQVATSPSELEETELGADMNPERCHKIGSIVATDLELDLAIIRMEISSAESFPTLDSLFHSAEKFRHENLNSPVIVTTTHHAKIEGRRAETPIYMRLPDTRDFQLLHSIRLSTPIRAGDCGSWVFDKVSGQIVGFVVAGSAKTRLCLVSPAEAALKRIESLLETLSTTASFGIPSPTSPTRNRGLENSNRESIGGGVGLHQQGEYKLETVSLDKYTRALKQPYGETSPNTPPFAPTVTYGQLSYFEPGSGFLSGSRHLGGIDIDIQGVPDNSFYISDGDWTCYHRRYISCI